MSNKPTYKQQLTKYLLKQLGNPNPSEKHTEFAEKLLLRTAVNRQLTFNTKLTDSEICCLYWAAQGYSAGHTALVMGTKHSTVESYRKEIKRKLKCNTIAQAVYEGICFGYVPTK
ncbi:MAG: autoinducer-binding domain protein [Gammaproteobacteria bacterium]|jgi:DNA-binding CsgD family transcriptional regulator|nr:autoinducer-binding domain protein [Gammaproteobacteria bacterium]